MGRLALSLELPLGSAGAQNQSARRRRAKIFELLASAIERALMVGLAVACGDAADEHGGRDSDSREGPVADG